MKLLPYITSFVKDAAKAVKRISPTEFKKVLDNTLTELLGIPTLLVKMYALRFKGEHEVLHLWCTHLEEVALCVHCGSLTTKFIKKSHGASDIWMCGAKRPSCISCIAVSNANIVAMFLQKNCSS